MTFKIILSGVTGSIGHEVLLHCLTNPAITSVVALTRRPLPELASRTKLQVVVLQDFKHYPDDVVAKLAGADGAVWCMTTTAGDPVLELEYPKAFAQALTPALLQHGKPFRYLHLTGAMVERDQDRWLLMSSGMRKLKGRGENQMIEIAQSPETGGLWETIVARPGGVVKRGTYRAAFGFLAGGSGWSIHSDSLALALVDAIVNASDEKLLTRELLWKRGEELKKELDSPKTLQ